MQEVPALVGYLLMGFGDQDTGFGTTLRARFLPGKGPLSPAKKLFGFSEELRIIDDTTVRINGKRLDTDVDPDCLVGEGCYFRCNVITGEGYQPFTSS